jgi:hypothetical protein
MPIHSEGNAQLLIATRRREIGLNLAVVVPKRHSVFGHQMPALVRH